MQVTIYTKDNCPQCHATMRFLKEKDIAFQEINITKHPDVIPELKKEGFQATPVIKTDDQTWTGFQPAKLQTLTN